MMNRNYERLKPEDLFFLRISLASLNRTYERLKHLDKRKNRSHYRMR